MMPQKPILLSLERHNNTKDGHLIPMLERALAPHFERVVHYRPDTLPPSGILEGPYGLSKWPSTLRKMVKSLILLIRKAQSPKSRHRKLWNFLETLTEEHDRIVILARSASAVAATNLADEFCLEKVVCLGYPFQNPANGPEPTRYTHLADLQTPCLIVQGNRDEYGGRDILDRYSFSPAIHVSFVETNHDFKLRREEWEVLIELIGNFVTPDLDPAALTESARSALSMALD